MAETQLIEHKESWRDEYRKRIAGFANAQGGTLLIGVNDNGQVVGVENAKRLLEDLPNKIQNTLGIVSDVNLLEQDGRTYIEIVTLPCEMPVAYHGEYHFRSGSTKQVPKGNALQQFLLNDWAKRMMMSLNRRLLSTIWMGSRFVLINNGGLSGNAWPLMRRSKST